MRIEHIALYVRDLEGARGFFETYLGAQAGEKYHNAQTGFTSYFLSFEDGARLEIMNLASKHEYPNPESSLGWAHLAFSLGSKAAVDKLTARLASDGFEVLSGPRTTGDGYYESCVVGFEGNLIELTV
ncbi:VOC family protein [Collinsella sp. AGMB00827]|uniref:VOC family protein n=1 Tax=Collinsella ureilytica TaxID=2869515 RepID=A0ABS7MHJ8_9ACTN|nr:VOC family protein [Collinsella urealyticum]MBY4796844.1 VOC family protein [Collinsella urealyticum]